MKKLLFSIMIFSIFTSCDKGDKDEEICPDEDKYYIKFQLKAPDGNTYKINIPQENPGTVNRHGLNDKDYVSTGFELRASFESPSEKDISQILSFYLSFTVPEEEFYNDSEVYKFKNPSSYKSYIPLNNLFQEGSYYFSSFFHEDLFCSAQVDETFRNDFTITKIEHYIDDNHADAMNVEGRFTTKYNLICKEGDVLLENGGFRVKILIEEIP